MTTPLISKDPKSIFNAARCFTCVSPAFANTIKTYLLTQAAKSASPPCVTPSTPVITAVTPFVAPNGLQGLTVSWSQPPNQGSLITSYKIGLSTVSGGPYNLSHPSGAGVRQVNFNALGSGNTYYFVVVANSFSGCSAQSAQASGTTGGGCNDGGVTAAWAAQVVVNGGTPIPTANQTAVCQFVAGAKADGFWNKIVAINIFDPTSLIGAQTPLLQGPGTQPWTNSSGLFVGADLSVNGLTANAGKTLQTGVMPLSFAPNNTIGFAWYCYNATATGFDLGIYNETTGLYGAAKDAGNNTRALNGTTASNALSFASSGNGYYCDLRVSSTDHRVFFANSTTPHAQIGPTDANNWGGAFVNGVGGFYIFALNDTLGSVQLNSNDTISAVAFMQGFTATDSANLFARLQALRQALGGGFR